MTAQTGALTWAFAFLAMGALGFNDKGFLILFGIVYLALGVIGIIRFGINGMGKLFGLLHFNAADNLLHIGLGILIALTGLSARGSTSNYRL